MTALKGRDAPPIPKDLDVDEDWEATTPAGFRVTVELWRRLGPRSASTGTTRAQVHLKSGTLLGMLTREPGAEPVAIPDEAAAGAYGDAWVADQLRIAATYLIQGHL